MDVQNRECHENIDTVSLTGGGQSPMKSSERTKEKVK